MPMLIVLALVSASNGSEKFGRASIDVEVKACLSNLNVISDLGIQWKLSRFNIYVEGKAMLA